MGQRILLICGSLQSGSANRRALEVIGGHLERLGIDVDEADEIAAIPAFNPEIDESEATGVASFLRRIAGSDSVVIAAPEYAGALAGAIKNALDWVVGAGHLYGKPVVVLSSGTTGGVNARHDLVRTLSWQGAHVIGSLGIAAPRTKSAADGRFTDPVTLDELAELAVLAAAAATLPGAERLRLVGETTAAAGVGTERIAPMPS
ncbi:MAG: NADPH-dependent FMN reductase [Ilumatobacteraceae bacterium]